MLILRGLTLLTGISVVSDGCNALFIGNNSNEVILSLVYINGYRCSGLQL